MTTHPPSIEKLVDELNSEVTALMQDSAQTVHEHTEQLRTQVQKVREKTQDYIQQEPVKAVLIAAAAGAALVLLTSWLSQRVK